jgi:hypothetical protein
METLTARTFDPDTLQWVATEACVRYQIKMHPSVVRRADELLGHGKGRGMLIEALLKKWIEKIEALKAEK